MHKYKIDCYFDYLLGNPYDFHASSERYSSCLMLGNYQKRRVESMDTVHDSEHVSDEEVVLGDRDSCDSHFVPKRRRLEEEDKYGLLTDEEESSFHISAKKTSLPFDESESESDEEMLKCRESLRDPEDSQWSDEEDIVNSDRDTVQHYKTLYSTHTKQQEHHDSDKVLGDIREEDKKQGDDEEDEDEEDEKDELISSSSSSPSPHLFYYLPSYASSTAGPSAHTSPPLFPPPPTSTSTTTSPLPTTTSPLPITTTTNTTSTSTSCRPCESVTTKVIVMQDTISELKQHIVSLEAKMDQQAQANEVKWQKMIQLVRDREKRCERYERWRKRLVRDLLREPSEQSKPNTV
ncbi:hypothetical protein BDF14DRAFT_1499806 [Spinellus fusiger]|nr:hypothetical protein BDF14DRAFT_1499806 [Spinellus fusiger]